MTINSKKATDKTRRKAMTMWQNMIENTSRPYISVEYCGESIRIDFDSPQEIKDFMREMIA